jgi:hypothetical protein
MRLSPIASWISAEACGIVRSGYETANFDETEWVERSALRPKHRLQLRDVMAAIIIIRIKKTFIQLLVSEGALSGVVITFLTTQELKNRLNGFVVDCVNRYYHALEESLHEDYPPDTRQNVKTTTIHELADFKWVMADIVKEYRGENPIPDPTGELQFG